MNKDIQLHVNQANECIVVDHLCNCDKLFIPPLSSRLSISIYAKKIIANAQRFEAWDEERLIGLVAAYCNDETKQIAYITSVSVLQSYQGLGIARQLLTRCIESICQLQFQRIELEVSTAQIAAVVLYEKLGFSSTNTTAATHKMILNFWKKTMTNHRDYNTEIKDTADHQYAYNFDFDVMHPYMIRSFEPFFKAGSFLELGSFKGDFTKRFLQHFDDVTCVEASGEAIAVARQKVGDKVQFVHSLFETVQLPKRYDNIVLTHVLEHIDDPVRVLKRINDEWLADGGHLFLVCPNANAPSRQIAVKMGLISHNAAVTPAEAEHGHRCTYTLDTLERDAVAAGLKVVHRTGIFFKALANFQWDRMLQTDIISKEYLDGCYKLGQQYPDLCSSIFLMCEK